MASRRSGSAARTRGGNKITIAKLRPEQPTRPAASPDHTTALRLLEERVDDNLACVRQALAIVDLVLKDERIARRDGALHALHAQLAAARSALVRTRASADDMRDRLDSASGDDPPERPLASSRGN
jgi:hypothetical protein